MVLLIRTSIRHSGCCRLTASLLARGAQTLVLLAFACLLGGCLAASSRGTTQVPAAAQPAASGFQDLLDRLGVPYRVPPYGKAILVNVPAFELVAFSDGEPALRSRVIVGTPWHPTPLIETYTSSVRFRPTWRPTPAMVRSGEYKDRIWPPGLKNPLGLAAVRLEPGLLVYLHDTNRRDLFQRDDRALSHGCIRVQRWDELIAWLLDKDVEEVHRLANGRETFDVVTPAVPVLIGYFTIFPDAQGEAARFPDIYGLGTTSHGARRAPENVAAAPAGCLAEPPSG